MINVAHSPAFFLSSSPIFDSDNHSSAPVSLSLHFFSLYSLVPSVIAPEVSLLFSFAFLRVLFTKTEQCIIIEGSVGHQ